MAKRGIAGIPVYPDMPDRRAMPEQQDDTFRVLLEDINKRMEYEHKFRMERAHAIWRKESPGYLTVPASGVFQGDMSMRPEKDCIMSVRTITIAGFTAGTVTVSRVNGVQILSPVAPGGTYTFGRREILLEDNDQLVITATGITGQAQVYLDSDEMRSWYYPWYVG